MQRPDACFHVNGKNVTFNDLKEYFCRKLIIKKERNSLVLPKVAKLKGINTINDRVYAKS